MENEKLVLYECNKDGWEKFMKENFQVEKGKLPPNPSFINNWLDMTFEKKEEMNLSSFCQKRATLV